MVHPAMIIRPVNCLLSAVAVVLAAIIALGTLDLLSWDHYLTMIWGAVIAALVAAGGNILNDVSDRHVDRINHPERPIPSGAIKPSSAKRIAVVPFVMAPGIAYITGLPWEAFMITILAILSLVAYEGALKRQGLAGNIMISFLVALLFLFGGAAVEQIQPTVVLAALAFLATLAREIVKDVEDMEGDMGRKTLPMRMGEKPALGAALGVIVAAVALSPLPVFPLEMFEPLHYLPVVALADGLLVYSAALAFKDPKRGSSFFKWGMAVALIAFLAGAIWT